MLESAQDARLVAKARYIGTTADLDGDIPTRGKIVSISTSVEGLLPVEVRWCLLFQYVTGKPDRRERTEPKFLDDAVPPCFGLVGLAGSRLGQDIAKYNEMIAVSSVHGKILTVVFIAINEKEVLLFTQPWFSPLVGFDVDGISEAGSASCSCSCRICVKPFVH